MANLKTEHFGYQEEQLYVFRETFTGNGVATTFQLTGNVGNATFETGEWLVSNVETAMAADVSRTTRAALYDSVLPLVRNKISVSSISATGLVTLDYAPMAENFYVWYWYDLEGDALEDYYRDDYVSSMEADAGVTIASGITTDTAAFDDRLSATEDTVQKALDVLDDYQETFSHVDMDAANLIGTPTYTTLHDWFNNLQSPGRVTGGVISDAGSSTVNIAAGTGYIRATDDDTADLKAFNWAATNGVAIAATSHKYIAVEYNSGSPQVAVYSTCAEFDFDTNFPLGSVVSESINGVETLYVMSNPWWVGDPITNIMERLLADSGLVVRDKFYGGLAISSTGTRCLAVTAGKLWTLLTEHDIAALDTNVSGTFDYYWYKAGTGWQSSAATQLSNTQWNDVTQTTLQALSSGRFVNAWVYAGASSLKIKVLYGQAQYSTIAQAQAQQAPSTLPVNLQNYGILLGRIILKQGTDTIQQVDSAFAYTFTLTASADHGNLAGLGDDDHTQYALAGASRAGTISVEATSVINQDVTTDASPTFASAYLGAASPAGPGTLVIYGVGSGAPGNANIQMYIGEDHDGTYDYYYIGVDADDLFIGVNSDQDRLKLTAEGDLYVTAGTVSCSDLTDGYVPYHVSDAAGLADSLLSQTGTTMAIAGNALTIQLNASTDVYLSLATTASNSYAYIKGAAKSSGDVARTWRAGYSPLTDTVNFVYGSAIDVTTGMLITTAGRAGFGLSNATMLAFSALTAIGPNYAVLQLTSSVTDDAAKGGAIVGARYDIDTTPFAVLGSWDTGAARNVYLGYGGWTRPDATQVLIGVAASYSEVNAAGLQVAAFAATDVYGKLTLGVADTRQGWLVLTGGATGTSQGGAITLDTCADYDTTVGYYLIQVNTDDLLIGPSTDTDALKLTDAGDLHITAGTVSCYDLTDGYVPYHVSDAAGLADSPLQVSGTYIGYGGVPLVNVHLITASTLTLSLESTAKDSSQVGLTFRRTNAADTRVGVAGIGIVADGTSDWGKLFFKTAYNINITHLDSSPVDMTLQHGAVTLNQGDQDGAILTLQSSDVAHGFTDIADTATFGSFQKNSATLGGLLVRGFSDTGGGTGISLRGNIGAADPTDTIPAVEIVGTRLSAATVGDLAAAETVFQVKNNATVVFTVKGSGSVTVGSGVAGVDYALTFDGETSDGIITWMEDEDYFTFSDDVNLATGERLLVVGNSPVLPADDAMELFWSFDEGSGAATYFVYDVSHNARHGTITGNPTWTDGISGYCMNFDGSGDYVLKSSGVTLTGDLTYSCWFKATAWPQSDFSSLMSNWWYSAPASYGWGFGFRTATTLYIQGGNGGGYFSTSRTVPELTAGVWYHVCVVHASGVFTIYINGVPASTTLTQAINHSGTTDQFVVGRGIVNYNGYYVNGCIDEARVYNRALTEAEVRSLYLNPSGSRGVRTTARRLTGGLSVGADGTVYVGEEDSTVYYSSLVVYGRGTGSVVGGRIYLHLAADHDTTITDYEINSYEDDLFVGPNTDTDALKLTSDKNLYLTDGDLYLQNAGTTYVRAFGDGTYGQINIGIQDTIPGYLLLYSSAAGSAVGGNVYLYLAADHDATIAYYGIRAYEDDLFIGPDTDTDLLKMTAEKDLYYTDGDVYIRNPSDVYARLYVGQATSHPGLVYIYGAATGSSTGGAIFLYTPDDHDGTIDYYQIFAYQDTLRIGPDTDTDALNLTAAKDLHITAGTVSCYDLTDGYVPYHVSDAAGFANSIIQVNSTTFTVGTGAAGVDYIIKVDGETNDGTITWMEDEAHFILSHDILVRQVEGAANANVYVGVNDTIYGQFQAYGHATGSAQGGTFVSYLAADYDTTIDYYMLQAYEDDLLIGPNTDTDALKLNSAKDLYLTDGDLYAQVGGTSFFQVFSALNAGWPDQMKLGRDDTNYARLEIYGHGAGSTAGGEVRIYCAADYDASVDAYIMCVSEDDLHIGPTSDDDALKLTSAKDLYLTAGSLVLPVSEYVNFGGTQGSTGYGLRDNAGYTQVKHSDYEDTWEDIERTHEIGKAIILTDDFVGAIALGHALGWSNTKSGTASDVSTQAIAGPNTGTVTLITGTDTTGYACIYLNNTIYANVWYTGDAKMEWVAFVGGALSDGTDTYKAWLGTGDVTTGGDFTEGAFFTYSHGESSGNWECVTMGAGETSTDSTVAAVANTWVRFTIIASADNATYKFYINGTLVATHTTNLPSAANGFIAKCVKSAGTTSRWLTVDAFYFRQRVSR